MLDRITFDPHVLGGRVCIRGLRIPVSVIVGQVAHGASVDEILEGYLDLERDDMQQAIDPIEPIAGELPRRQRRLVEAWAELHEAELMADWERLQGGQAPQPIEPLR